jgi:HTH-type transcriptional regulator, competence development regulator
MTFRMVKDFKSIICQKRTELGYSIRRFAKMAGISAGYLSRIEAGEVDPPTEAIVIRMAELLGLNKDQLLASANKVSTDLLDIIRADPIGMADLIRSASASAAKSFALPEFEDPPTNKGIEGFDEGVEG